MKVGDLVEFTRRDIGIEGSSLALIVEVEHYESPSEHGNPDITLMFMNGSVVKYPLRIWKEFRVVS